jgi:integrase
MPRLTDIRIRNAKPAQELLLPDGGNLYLRIRPKPTAEKGFSYSWLVRIKRHGRRRVHSLGIYPGLTIKEARAEAARIVAKERGEARVDVRSAVEDYLDVMIRPHYRRVNNAEVYARRLQARLGSIAVDAVRPVDVSRLIAEHVREAPVAAMRMLGFAKQFFNWCVGMGYVDRSPIADVQSRVFGVVEESRERILTDDEIKALWHAPDLPHRALLRFLLLTGLRIGEAQAAQRDWIDADDWLALPAEVMKAGKPHRCCLSPLAREQIEAAAAPHLFRVVSPTSVQAAVHRWQDRHGVTDRWTPHDLRRTFASRCGDLGIAPHVIAKLLAHTFTPSASLPVYLRSEWIEERKQATMALAAHIAGLVGGQT